MKRDPHLVRALLLHFEGKENDQMDSCPAIPEYTPLEVGYHLILLYEAGFIRAEAEVSKAGRVIMVYPFSLTWTGHEFLDAARDDNIWNKTMKRVSSTTGAVSFSVLQALLVSYAKQTLGI